ncbi:MAG: Uma2 family endonuclease [Microcoleus sp. PH2017_29_MFU_D_A]|jgi:Uma2 family endonuclease|uniref:Uma2 family endonuclease n=1 Tax=unclassified Microcoleus TaxID=2642155 RepID=UPI001DE752C0|nr:MULTISPECIES: Uma2 family endonuclease [unclassified Microcoleus]MCC3419634.1 Uma2 family endonuclease [Microcoleus sp. PH2017_07_MST_O_A]MCC3510167.1 Uma2 family endonuclease [Microcoleus sp. PH2017_17_BER_D_A]TAE52300.1 MAG: Uma2 family endonuclease [Oscillatoriales cyanobacterium]MCC3414556.1 Uma2 family endonuclease [Microcoleus sp. PH2017_02_FOX_O_A]MCC3422916.1 Uma2 family endonuclease [Microcoleus sp. PH2017_01_SCD_O_A]
MTVAKPFELGVTHLPDHTELPESDGTFVKNFQELPQSIILTDSLRPVLQKIHPDGRYRIGQDCGIYWRLTDPPERGAEAPDWFYVPNVPPLLNGQVRRSYVLWKEYVAPLIAIEFVSGNGSEERDRTPPPDPDREEQQEQKPGKFWVYEQAIRIPFYGIYEVKKAAVEMYHLEDNRYQRLSPNDRGRYPIPQLGVELGIWQGEYDEMNLPWLRWWDSEGNLLLIGEERAQQESLRAQQESLRAQQESLRADEERLRADRLAEKLRQMGINPDEL